MRVLIAVLSCVQHELNGFNQVIRETWMSSAYAQGFDCRFFIGDGTATGEDETNLLESFERQGIFRNKATQDPDLRLMPPKIDQVIVSVPDDYIHQAYKFRQACRWAVRWDFDYVFQVLTDTFVVPSRLSICGFEEHDYIGTANNERTAIGGGAGMWLSRRALNNLIDEPIDVWGFDDWVGRTLLKKGFSLMHDSRYTNLGQVDPPRKDNDAITCHIANTPTVYDPKIMFELQREFD